MQSLDSFEQSTSRSSYSVLAYGSTHVGMVRESNQDAFCMEESLGLFLVADGMGGKAGGEIASRLAVNTILSEVKNSIHSILRKDLVQRRVSFANAINSACLKIYERSLELPQYRGMGTTATLLWVPPKGLGKNEHYRDHAVVAHVGDSRCYLLRSGLFYQLTDDHSLINEQIKAGILQPTDPLIHSMKNVITRCVGYQEEEEVDTRLLRLESQDRFLICSDGLTNKLADNEIAEILAHENLENVPEMLIDLANKRGGEDNITAVVLEIMDV
jgi:serine/threonine protein phosphatase PrpC